MRDGWREVALGELFTASNVRLGQHREEPEVFSVTKYDGFVLARDYFGKRIASTKLDTYKVVEVDEWAYSTIHIDEGSIARNRLGVKGVVSPMYTTMRLDTNAVEPFYCELLLRSPWMLARYGDAQQGSINRRKSLPWKVFASLTVPIPPLREQKRVVDLITTLDNTIDSNETAQRAAESVLTHVRSSAVAGEHVPLDEMVTMRSGPSWKAADELPNPGPGLHPVLGITNTPAGRRLKLADQRFVRGIPTTAHRLDDSSLVMIRTNGNRSRIGNIYWATPEVNGFAVSAFQIAVQPRHPTDAAFLYWYLGSADVQQSISDAASGTTGLGNIAVGWLKKLRIPYMGEAKHAEYIATCEAAGAVQDAMVTAGERLQLLRSHLLTALLSGAHQIPDSYDSLIEKAA